MKALEEVMGKGMLLTAVDKWFREDFSEKVVFQQRFKWNKDNIYVAIWKKGVSGSRNSRCKGSEVRLTFLKNYQRSPK